MKSFIAGFFLAVFPVAHLSAQVYTLRSLPQRTASGINDSGAVVGWTWGSSAVYWREDTSYGLGAIVPGGVTTAYAVNNSDQIVGGTTDSANPSYVRPFIRTGSAMSYLPDLPGTSGWATCVNDSGWSAGLVADSTANFNPYFWKDGSFTNLGTLGGIGGGAAGINNQGQVVGVARVNDTMAHAFVWENGSMTDLGTFGGYNSEATAINNLGHVVGIASPSGTTSGTAFIAVGGGLSDLGAIAHHDSALPFSMASDINDSGVVVGTSSWEAYPLTHNLHAFVWKDGVMRDLNAVADTSGGWELTGATGVNNRGDIISQAVYYGSVYSVLLRPADVLVTVPKGNEFWISGDKDTIRWLNGLGEGAMVRLDLSLDDGQTWDTIAAGIPADSQQYAWTVPDTFSAKARIRVVSAVDESAFDVSEPFKLRGYILTRTTVDGEYVVYQNLTDRWGLGNTGQDIWPPDWYARFSYGGIDPFTGKSYLLGGAATADHFLYAQPSDFPDWPSFVRTFHPASCYLDMTAPVYRPSAVTYWASIRKAWGGSCFGFALANAWAFDYRDLLHLRHPAFPDFKIPLEVGSDTNVIPVINNFFTHQFGKNHLQYRASVGLQKTPNQTLADLKKMFIDDYEPIRTFSFLNNGPGGGGHAIIAYGLKQDTLQPQLYHVFVYDNSYPDNLESEVIFDTAGNGGQGTWSNSLWPGWGGSKWIYLRNPSIEYDPLPPLPESEPREWTSPFFDANGQVYIHLRGAVTASIRDSAGNVSGYIDSLMRADIPGSAPLVVEDGSAGPPYGYSLPGGAYRIEMTGFDQPQSRAFFFAGSRIFTAARGGTSGDQTDRYTYDGSLTVTNPDTTGKVFNVSSIINEGWIEKVYSLKSLLLGPNDSVRTQPEGTDGLKISSFSLSPRSYDLDLEHYTVAGIERFSRGAIDLDANSAHIFRPVWPAVGDSLLKILIDHGNDGTIDDSMLVSNDPTDVDGAPGHGTPASFAVYQNYPNPFNPRTLLRYALPVRSHVRVQIVNVLGEIIATLVDGEQGPGEQVVEWDASGFPGGVYFYRVTAGASAVTKKMVLVR